MSGHTEIKRNINFINEQNNHYEKNQDFHAVVCNNGNGSPVQFLQQG